MTKCRVCGVSTLWRGEVQLPVGEAGSRPGRASAAGVPRWGPKGHVGGAEGEDVGAGKPVPAAPARLHLLFQSVCSGLVGAVLHSLQILLQMISKQEGIFCDLSAQRWLLLTF